MRHEGRKKTPKERVLTVVRVRVKTHRKEVFFWIIKNWRYSLRQCLESQALLLASQDVVLLEP